METPSKSQAASSTPKREAPERETFRAGDLNRITGLTYRQVNDWDARVGALPHGDRSEAGWRKFSADEVLAVAVCAALRRDFGVPLEKLAWLQSHMLQERAPGYFQLATNMAKAGLAVFVVTDLVSEFIVDSDLNLRWMFEDGQFRSCEAKTHVMLRVNAILNSMWATAVQDFAEMKLNRKLYRKVLETEAHARAQNTAELE